MLYSPSSWSWVKTGNINWITNDKAIAALPAANARMLNSNALFSASLVPIPSALGALAGDAIQNNSL